MKTLSDTGGGVFNALFLNELHCPSIASKDGPVFSRSLGSSLGEITSEIDTIMKMFLSFQEYLKRKKKYSIARWAIPFLMAVLALGVIKGKQLPSIKIHIKDLSFEINGGSLNGRK